MSEWTEEGRAELREDIVQELDAAGFTGAELWYDEMVNDLLRERLESLTEPGDV